MRDSDEAFLSPMDESAAHAAGGNDFEADGERLNEVQALFDRAQSRQDDLKPLLARMAELRERAASPASTEQDWLALKATEAEMAPILDELRRIEAEMIATSGIPEEYIELIEQSLGPALDEVDRTPRTSVAGDEIEPSGGRSADALSCSSALTSAAFAAETAFATCATTAFGTPLSTTRESAGRASSLSLRRRIVSQLTSAPFHRGKAMALPCATDSTSDLAGCRLREV